MVTVFQNVSASIVTPPCQNNRCYSEKSTAIRAQRRKELAQFIWRCGQFDAIFDRLQHADVLDLGNFRHERDACHAELQLERQPDTGEQPLPQPTLFTTLLAFLQTLLQALLQTLLQTLL